MLNNLDLNLLRVFDALMRERSVLRAGQRVGLSQSAVSHALSRLRGFMKDDLFVRTGQSMEPTSRAYEMGPLVRDALTALEQAISNPDFDPARSSREFHIAATDYITRVVAPFILRDLAESAPAIDLIILPATRIDLATQIDLGRIDIAIGRFSKIPPRLYSTVLFEDVDMLVMSPDHPLASQTITVEALARFPLVAVAAGGAEDRSEDGFISERGLSRRSDMFDRDALVTAFAQKGLTPRISVLLPHFLAIPSLIIDSDRVALMPTLLAQAFQSSLNLATSPTPWSSTPMAVQTVWHERSERSPAHRWLRQRIEMAAQMARSKYIKF
jgi:DNA-binding transcriptional LysR family regulator